MPLPLARTPRESHLYIDLHACECGEREVEQRSHSTGQGDGYWTRQYDFTCPGCGAERRFVFRVPDWPQMIDEYGGPEPSEIIDAGQWLIIADLAARATPVSPAPEEEADSREALQLAVDAMREVLKFVPDREPAVPDSAFWTPEGRTERDQEPGRFRRPRLEVVLKNYQDALTELS